MATRKNIVPQAIELFNSYVIVVLPYILLNKARLLITEDNYEKLDALVNDPDEGWAYLHHLHSNKATKNMAVNLNLVISETSITKLLQMIYNDIPRSYMTSTDFITFHISVPKLTRGVRPKITNIPFGKIHPIGGGRVGFIVRTDTEAKRASMETLADVIWVEGIILKPSDPLPIGLSQCNIKFTSTSALFNHQFPVEEIGNRFACFLHYANLTDDSKSGPVSNILICIIA